MDAEFVQRHAYGVRCGAFGNDEHAAIGQHETGDTFARDRLAHIGRQIGDGIDDLEPLLIV